MKTLILVDHPEIENSIINKRWMEEVEKYPDEFTIRLLQDHAENYNFDIEEEQRIVEEHGNIVLQFPVYWFSSPSLVKKWLDEVVCFGWAFGGGGDAFKDRKISLAASFGVLEESMSANGAYGFTADEVFAPFKASCLYMGANYGGAHCLFGAEHEPSQEYIEENSKQYVEFLRSL